ncbi:MAG: MalY/PatB family protein [Opitutales bacterium]
MQDAPPFQPDRAGTGSLKWEKYAGTDILPMWVADMDLPSPPTVIEALEARARHGIFGYTKPYEGVVSAVQDYLSRDHGLAVAPRELVWFPGLVPALNTAARAFAAEGEAVLTCTPVYPPFLSAPINQQRQLQAVPLREGPEGYAFDYDAMEAAVTPATKVFFLCNPMNPVGSVLRREEVERVLEFCQRHDLVLISDEIHCDLLLDEEISHTPALSLPGAAERTLALMAPSKTYNLPGLACSYLVVPDSSLRARFQRAAQGMITEVNCMGYTGCEAAYRHGGEWLADTLRLLRANRARLYAFIEEECPEVKLRPMQATYLAWLDVRALGLKDPAKHFENHGLGLSDGGMFGSPGWLRLNFGCPAALLEEGLRRFAAAYRKV